MIFNSCEILFYFLKVKISEIRYSGWKLIKVSLCRFLFDYFSKCMTNSADNLIQQWNFYQKLWWFFEFFSKPGNRYYRKRPWHWLWLSNDWWLKRTWELDVKILEIKSQNWSIQIWSVIWWFHRRPAVSTGRVYYQIVTNH